MDFFRLALQLAGRPLPGRPGRLTLAGLVALGVPVCAAVGAGLAAEHVAFLGYALALALGVAAVLAIPALSEALRARAAELRKFRGEAAKAADGAWASAVRRLLPRLAARWTAAAAAQRRAIVPRPPALAGRRVVAALTLTPRLLPIPAARRAVH